MSALEELMTLSQVCGFAGTLIVFVAYLPQIVHLVKEHCSAGVSLWAFALWLVASILLFAHAALIPDTVFMVMQGVNTLASAVILFFGWLYRGQTCAVHRRKT